MRSRNSVFLILYPFSFIYLLSIVYLLLIELTDWINVKFPIFQLHDVVAFILISVLLPYYRNIKCIEVPQHIVMG